MRLLAQGGGIYFSEQKTKYLEKGVKSALSISLSSASVWLSSTSGSLQTRVLPLRRTLSQEMEEAWGRKLWVGKEGEKQGS